MQKKKKEILKPTDADAIRLARTLLRTARYGALAVLEPETGAPFASRVAVATDQDGAPLILISELSGHTSGLVADTRCSLLLGEPGKGDPLAHSRITISCHARRIARDDTDYPRIEMRFLSRNPKSKLYASFGDFAYFRLEPRYASLNGGFGKAYALTTQDLLTITSDPEAFAETAQSAIEHMNKGHSDAVTRLARHYGKAGTEATWIMTGIDADGFDLVSGDQILRIFFDVPLTTEADIHPRLITMTVAARKADAGVNVQA